MPTIDLGQVKGDAGASMRMVGVWTANTAYVNNSQYIDVVTYEGSSYACVTSHTSGASFSNTNWSLIAQKGAKGSKGDTGAVPTIKAGTVTSLDATASPTVSVNTSGNITTFNFGIPKGDTSDIKTPTFDDSTDIYTTLNDANTAAETASNEIKNKVNLFTILSNMKKSFSAIIQGLKILGTNVGKIQGITSDLNSESDYIAASSKALAALNGSLTWQKINTDTWVTASGFVIAMAEHCPAIREVHLIVYDDYTKHKTGSTLITVPAAYLPISPVIGLMCATFDHTSNTVPFFIALLRCKNNGEIYANYPASGEACMHRIDVRYRY